MPSLGISLSLPDLGARGGSAGGIILSANSIAEAAANNTTVGTASILGLYTGTPSWSISDADITFNIDSLTGVVKVNSNTDLVWATHPAITATISVGGTTPSFSNLVGPIIVTQPAATLSSPSATAGDATASLGVSADKGDGVLYWIVTTNAAPPSAAAIIAGIDAALNPAAALGSQAVSATGAQTASASGLTDGVTYYAYFAQTRPSGTKSAVAASVSFVPVSSGGSSKLLLHNGTDALLLHNGTDHLTLHVAVVSTYDPTYYILGF